MPTCICLQETLITNAQTKPPSSYNIVRSQPTRQDGHERGVAILVNNSDIHSIEIKYTTSSSSGKDSRRKKLAVCLLYLPHIPVPKADIVSLLRQLPSPFLLLGDMNAKSATWGENMAEVGS